MNYLTSGKWVVDLTRWLITTGGTIAESAFLLATVYVTTNTVAHLLVTWLLPDRLISTLNQVSVIAFSVLPELIIFSAMKVTLDHWKMVWRTGRMDAWIWAVCYTIPTSVFLIMTVITITSFVNLEAIGVSTHQATGAMLVIRCLAGWSYGMVQMLFASLGKPGYVEAQDRLVAQIQDLESTVESRDRMITSLQENSAALQRDIQSQEQELFKVRMALAQSKATRGKNHIRSAKSPMNVTPIRARKTQDASSEHESPQPVDSHVESSRLDSPQSLDTRFHKTVHLIGLESLQSLDSSVHKIGHENPQPLDTDVHQTVQLSDHKSPQLVDESVQSSVYKTVQLIGMGSEQPEDSRAQSTVQKSGSDSQQLLDTSVHATVYKSESESGYSLNKTVHKNKADGSEAAKKMRRILRRNPSTGPTELAAKAGVSRSYASLIKSQFLAALEDERSV